MQGFGVSEYHFILVCRSKSQDILIGVLYGYKALLQVIALILAFTTRKVKVKGLNDTIYIAAAVYVSSLLWAVVIVSTYSLVEYLNVFTAVFSFSFLVGTTTIVTLVFAPKVRGGREGRGEVRSGKGEGMKLKLHDTIDWWLGIFSR